MDDQGYVSRWFLNKDAFLSSSGASETQFEDLLAAGAMPGVIYSQSSDGDWWSILGAAEDSAAPAGGEDWYSPAAVWWCRRAILAIRQGSSAEAAAQVNKEHFLKGFVGSLALEPLAKRAFPSAFLGDRVETSARKVAEAEWDSWISGGYAVCLRRFSAETCIRKESLGHCVREHFAGAEENRLDDQTLFDLVERLEALILPFSPWERPNCTPGKAVDPALEFLQLGREYPYGSS